jgi:hypothetical protein
LGAGKFEPREVRMGVQAENGMVEVLSGLRPGELVVTSGQFLLDSEARIREALGKMIRGDMASDQERAAVLTGSSELESLPEGMATDLTALLDRYFEIGAKLSADQLEGTAPPAREISDAVERLLGYEIPGKPHFWHEHDEIARVRGKALELASSEGLEQARPRFGDLSVSLTELLGATGVPPGYGKEVRELRCPMFREGQGGSIWLQPAGDVRNPYFGSVMLECFDRMRSLPTTGQVGTEKQQEGTEPTPAGAGETRATPPKGGAGIDDTMAAYLAIGDLLASDESEGLSERFADLIGGAERLTSGNDPFVREIADILAASARATPADIAGARKSFVAISRAMLDLLEHVSPGDAVAPSLYEAYCPMVRAPWLQIGDTIRNPYYGAAMLDCGTIRRTIRGTRGSEDDR